MLCFWRWKQVYASTSTVDCDQVCNALSEAGVRYIRKGKTGHPVLFFGWGHRRAHDGKRYDGNSGAFDHVLYLCTAEGRRKGQLFAIPPLTVRIGGRGFPEKEKDLEDNRFPNPFCYA